MKDTQPVSGLDDSNSRLLFNGERVFGNCYYRRKDSPFDMPWTFVGQFIADYGLAVNSEDEFEYRLPSFVGEKDQTMSTSTDNGGQAFLSDYIPGPATTTNPQGMTLRDYFAGQADKERLDWLVDELGIDFESGEIVPLDHINNEAWEQQGGNDCAATRAAWRAAIDAAMEAKP